MEKNRNQSALPRHHSTLGLAAIIRLDRKADASLGRQLLEGLRTAILAGSLRSGSQLPPSRMVAGELGVSRNTVIFAFEQLVAEGYLRSRVGSGTYVRENLPEIFLRATQPRNKAVAIYGRRRVSRSGRVLSDSMSVYATAVTRTIRPFYSGLPALDAFPYRLWMRVATRAWQHLGPRDLAHGDPRGYRPLRESIAAYLEANRGARCGADQIIIVGGAQQALDLAARVLLDPGDAAWIEDPDYFGARAALLGAGARLVPIPVDGEGLQVDIGLSRAPRARLAFVTPSHQQPLGAIMSLRRRLALLDWAQRAGAWILEDDNCAEFRYTGPPLPALQGIDTTQRVIYIGTFSKTLFPALRLGYLVVPPDLVRTFSSARAVLDLSRPILDQATLAAFMMEGHYIRHVRRMRLLYEQRQRVLLATALEMLADHVEIAPGEAGMHLIGWLRPGIADRRVAACARDHECFVTPLSWLTLKRRLPPGLILPYAAFNASEITHGVRRLARALNEVSRIAGP